MKICLKGTVAHLLGDLTNSGMSHGSIDALNVSLLQIEAGGRKNIRIDCTKIRLADICGLQLLYVWMQCVRLRRVEPELVNLSDSLQQAIHGLGLWHCFA